MLLLPDRRPTSADEVSPTRSRSSLSITQPSETYTPEDLREIVKLLMVDPLVILRLDLITMMGSPLTLTTHLPCRFAIIAAVGQAISLVFPRLLGRIFG